MLGSSSFNFISISIASVCIVIFSIGIAIGFRRYHEIKLLIEEEEEKKKTAVLTYWKKYY
jgi:hypothetical protein